MNAWRALICAAICVASSRHAAAQQPAWSTCGDTVGGSACAVKGLSRRQREQAEALYNAPATRREKAPFTLARDSVIRGALAVTGGPVRIAGTINGALLVINGDVEFTSTATVTGDVAVLGGRVTSTDSARLGALRVEADSIPYAIDAGMLHLEAPFDEVWRLIGHGEQKSAVGVRLALTRTYNRVEGLPIEFGPRLRFRTKVGTVAADLFGIFRTGSRIEWNGNNVGHNARVEFRFGRNEHWSIGGRLFDVVAPVEDWQLSDVEVGLAAFVGHSDYRDYFDRHGGGAMLGYRDGRAFHATLELTDERWRPRVTLTPFSLWRNEQPWRANPDFDRARYTRTILHATYDTRTDPRRPRSGWWLQGDYELGIGAQQTYGTEIAAPVPSFGQRVTYGRGMLDLRRYSRLSPSAQINTRLMVGGWLHGDALPLQRRLSLSGPGANSGFAFRDRVTTPDRLQCSGSVMLSGSPALCDGMLLLSADYRHDIRWLVDLFAGARLIQPDRSGYGGWVLFTDVGRGWLKKTRATEHDPPSGGPRGFNALQTSAGAGLEIGQGGVYIAKALGAPASHGVQFFVRLVRRY